MQLPSILQGESLTRLLQGAAAGAVAIMFVTARQMSADDVVALPQRARE